MNTQFDRYLKGTLILLDLLALNLINFSWQSVFVENFDQSFIYAYNRYFLVSNGIWILFSFLIALYNIKVILEFNIFIKKTTQVFFLYSVALLFYLFFSRELLVSRQFIFYSTASFALSLIITRFLFLGSQEFLKKSNVYKKKVLILGYNETAKVLTEYLEAESQSIRLVGYLEDPENVNELTNYPILGDISTTLDNARKLQVTEIFSTVLPRENDIVYNLMHEAEKGFIKFRLVPDLQSQLTFTPHIEFYGKLPVLSSRNSALDDMGNLIKKRILDIVVSSLVIILILSWMVPLLGLLVIIESGFPVFFKQKRTGFVNKPFWCYKFRSMKKNKDADLKQATHNDMRITRIGRIIRKTSLDEFPQFINVFKGDMSLVGPRPHMLKHTADYSKIVDEFMIRQFIKPGITGWAQINGYRGEIKSDSDIRKRVEKDLWYMEHWTLWLDVQILFLTVFKILKGQKNVF